MNNGLVAGSDDYRSGFRHIVELLIWLVILPTAALLAVGVLMLVFWQAQLNILFGILVVTLVGCLVTGVVLSLVLLRREAKLSKLQLDFVSKVSHELRTPLTSIRMFAEMLQAGGGQDAEETRLCLDVLQRETTRLSERIERLLDWGRMEAGRRTYDRRPDSVAAVAQEAVETFGIATMGQDVAVHIEVPPDLPPVLVDRAAMVDALVNLLNNAYKYTPKEKRITLRAWSDRDRVRIAVSDNGIGIARHEHRRIFDKFYRADERLSRAVEGSGLGLAIVRHVALGHGGRIELESEPGKGSTFTIVLPWATPQELAGSAPTAGTHGEVRA
jgi:two-component system phosphate regulon sensor histidine kinase PhoR